MMNQHIQAVITLQTEGINNTAWRQKYWSMAVVTLQTEGNNSIFTISLATFKL